MPKLDGMRPSAALLLFLAAGCAASPPPPVSVPPPAPVAPEPEPPVAEKPGIEAAAVPPPPAECEALAAHPTNGCAPSGPALVALAAAVEHGPSGQSDAALACIENLPDFPPGLVRALRAEIGPSGCADALVTPVLENPPEGLSRETEGLMLGLVVSARLARLLADPPSPEPPVTKQRFQAFFAEVLTPWVLSQAAAIEKLSLTGAHLGGYGRGVAAIAAGNADLRFVEMVRAVSLPDEMKADKAVEATYYAALDEALEPRKVRGRDAALVGLRAFAAIGSVHDERVERARALLTKLWSGSRVDTLDRLMLPDLPELDTSRPELVLANQLPTFYMGELVPDADPTDTKLLRALLGRGFPAKLQKKVEVPGAPPAARALLAHALVELGQRYFRARAFQRASALLSTDKLDDGKRLLLAIAKALVNGPEDAAELMVKGPFVNGTGDVSALDAEVARRSRYAGRAAFDAAYLLQLAPRQNDPTFWDDIVARFSKAEKLLEKGANAVDTAAVPLAHEYAKAAKATAATLRKTP